MLPQSTAIIAVKPVFIEMGNHQQIQMLVDSLPVGTLRMGLSGYNPIER
jgi:hypothetical protein